MNSIPVRPAVGGFEPGDMCSICLETTSFDLVQFICCNSLMHRDCLGGWHHSRSIQNLSTSCPNCRYEPDPEDPVGVPEPIGLLVPAGAAVVAATVVAVAAIALAMEDSSLSGVTGTAVGIAALAAATIAAAKVEDRALAGLAGTAAGAVVLGVAAVAVGIAAVTSVE